MAAAFSILLLSKNPYGEIGWLDMLKGEVITISNFDLVLTAATLTFVLAALGLFHKELLLVSFDREMAIILRKNVVFWDILLYLLIGLTVSMAVLSVGPLIAFGFLLIPALTAHQFARNMRQFTVLASLIGGATAFFGFWTAYQWDLPVGPTDVVLPRGALRSSLGCRTPLFRRHTGISQGLDWHWHRSKNLLFVRLKESSLVRVELFMRLRSSKGYKMRNALRCSLMFIVSVLPLFSQPCAPESAEQKEIRVEGVVKNYCADRRAVELKDAGGPGRLRPLSESSVLVAEERFVDRGDGTVTDTRRKIMWQKGDNGKEVTFEEAQEYCKTLRLGGYADWCLPKADEVDTAVAVKLMMPHLFTRSLCPF